MGIIAWSVVGCFAGCVLLGILFEVFTFLLGNVAGKHIDGKRNNSSESMDDGGFVYAAMYLSMHDE